MQEQYSSAMADQINARNGLSPDYLNHLLCFTYYKREWEETAKLIGENPVPLYSTMPYASRAKRDEDVRALDDLARRANDLALSSESRMDELVRICEAATAIIRPSRGS
jgi:hypothetical protein